LPAGATDEDSRPNPDGTPTDRGVGWSVLRDDYTFNFKCLKQSAVPENPE